MAELWHLGFLFPSFFLPFLYLLFCCSHWKKKPKSKVVIPEEDMFKDFSDFKGIGARTATCIYALVDVTDVL